nr:7TM GPCR domain containing protein [Haemonchus contortus]
MKPWGFLWLCLFIGVYGLNTALLALHFVYRYIVVCRQQLSHIFQETSSVVIVILSVISWGFIYSLITFVCFAANEDCYEYINPSFYEKFGEDLHNLSFVCVFTHKVEPNTTTIYWLPTIGMGLNFIMMIATFALMFFCGFKIYRALKKSSMSQKSKVLQTQLLKAVAIQSLRIYPTGYIHLHGDRSSCYYVLRMRPSADRQQPEKNYAYHFVSLINFRE